MNQHEVVPELLDGERLDRLVSLQTGVSRSVAARAIEDGQIRVDGQPVTQRSRRVKAGQVLEFAIEVQGPCLPQPDPLIDVEVVYADDTVIVIDKPAGIVVHPGAGNTDGTLVNGLLARFPELAEVGEPERPGIVHRIDKGTSGLLMVARTPGAYEGLVGQLSARSVDRRYRSLVWGNVEPGHGVVDAPIGRSRRDPTRMTVAADGREARTRYQVESRFNEPAELCLVTCELETGRTHQIRVHLRAINHPVVGDTRYGGARQSLPCPRPWLHAEHLGFRHPVTDEWMSFDSEVPGDLAAVARRCS
ncbi:MAG: RluA family pseudouridine synthase [Actinomycetia bacterium]|nr:RluA family pseudouridine synthase [Actinomycetes bacterium]